MKTLAQVFNAELPFKIYDEAGKLAYLEDATGWIWQEYLDGFWVYYEDSDGYWVKREIVGGRMIYYEDSHGKIRSRRV